MVRQLNPKKTKGMQPVKEWLNFQEACDYLSVGRTTFKELMKENRLTISSPKGRMYYFKVSELKAIFENNIIIRQENKNPGESKGP